MRRLLVSVLTIALLGSLAAAADGQDGERRTVRVDDNYFVKRGDQPRTVRVRKNTRVVWRFRGDNTHNVVVTDGPTEFDSDAMSSGSFSKKMKRRGTYDIVCTFHSNMAMTLKVRR